MRVMSVAMLALSLAAGAGAASAPQFRVIDGDTVALDALHVRLVGLNAPDSGQTAACPAERAAAPKATQRLGELIAGGAELTLVQCSCPPKTLGTKDCNFGRACGILTVGGVDVAATLISEGLAAPFQCGKTKCPKLPHPWCSK